MRSPPSGGGDLCYPARHPHPRGCTYHHAHFFPAGAEVQIHFPHSVAADTPLLLTGERFARQQFLLPRQSHRLFYASDAGQALRVRCLRTTAALDQRHSLRNMPVVSRSTDGPRFFGSMTKDQPPQARCMPTVRLVARPETEAHIHSSVLFGTQPRLRRLGHFGACSAPRRLPVMCSTVRHSTVVRGMTAVENGKSGARYCAMSTRSARSLLASGTTAMRP